LPSRLTGNSAVFLKVDCKIDILFSSTLTAQEDALAALLSPPVPLAANFSTALSEH